MSRPSNWLSRRPAEPAHLHSRMTRSPLPRSTRRSGIPCRLRRSARADNPRLRSVWANRTLTPSSRTFSGSFSFILIFQTARGKAELSEFFYPL